MVEKIPWFSQDLSVDGAKPKYSLTILVNLSEEKIDF